MLILASIVIAFATRPDEVYLFRSYHHPGNTEIALGRENDPQPPDKYAIWQVGRATTAVPFYFPPLTIDKTPPRSFFDASIVDTNPTVTTYESVIQSHGNDPRAVQLLVSIGTGKTQSPPEKEGRGSMISKFVTANRFRETLSRMAEERLKDRAERAKWAMERVPSYWRIDVEEGLGNVKLDEWKGKGGKETSHLIRDKTQVYLSRVETMHWIAKAARQLVDVRRARANDDDTDHWERFCFVVEYACPVNHCKDADTIFKERRELRRHLEVHHPASETLESLLDKGKRFLP